MAATPIAVTTRSYNNYRDGVNNNESVLTALAVQKNGIDHLFDCLLPGDARGTEGMPLVVPGLKLPNGQVHDVLFVASMDNTVRAFDANTPTAARQGNVLWQRNLGRPVKGSRAIDIYLINDNWGVLSTPVINLATKTIYCCAMTSADGQITDSQFWLHAMSLLDGSDQTPPVLINNATYQPPNGLKRISFGSVPRKQRCGLAFDSRNGVDTVFIANGSFNEDATTNQGWVVAVDATNLKLSIAAAWTTTSRYYGAGIWQGAQGLSIDDQGCIHGMTGNGAFDGITDFGESFFKLQYTPKTATTPASIVIVDWFTPFTDTGRVGADATLPSTSLIPGWEEANVPGGPSNMNAPGDEDLASGGPLILPKAVTGYKKDLVLGAGKDGIIYVIDMNNMGKSVLSDFAPTKIANNYAKLLAPPYGLTYFPDGISLTPTVLTELPTTAFGRTHHMHATPVYYKSPRFGPMLFAGGENGPVRAFQIGANYVLNYLGCGAEVASAQVPDPGGMPGTMITLSANQNIEDTAILWCLQPYGNANTTVTAGRLIAYGADWINNGALVKIWDSQDWALDFMHNKFNIPTVANGKLYVPTYDARVMVFGLA